MGNSNVKQHLDTAEKTGALQLCKLGLKEFPENLQKLSKNLRTLDFSDNKIAVVPSAIGSFQQLKTVNLNNNRIESLPQEIGNLKKLETLSLDSNILRQLPATFPNLKHLRTVNLSGNGFKTFPQELCDLTHLDAIDLSRNRITEIPPNSKTCHTIELNLNQNQISTLPDCIAEWPRLKVLRLEENCLEITALTPRIMKESQISLLAVEGNVFDMKKFNNLEGYDNYMERYTATKKKFN
ncbi:leucine-rich repeat-containing protein 57-like [Mercenaria mercenaria]|uniref:leucine-rich repeat-containing protein 57-like n=1 Tax=Mercenaria mercenaria TaxID=6596 RepID=UPI00234F24D8|nr:leucine-rich repeat-containing protein 57-like [Mercenaria mercenaria]